jgi:tryptophan synthase alpha chain
MQLHQKISAALNKATDSGRVGLVPFITAGYPVKDEFIKVLSEICKDGDVVEVGVPFSDPMADGITIQRSSHSAIEQGVTLNWIIEQLAASDIDTPIVLMSYLNPLLAYGYEALAADAAKAGVCGFIVPDLPWEESEQLRAALDTQGLGLVQLVTPATPEDRLEMLCKVSQGFVYAVTVTGVTGGGQSMPPEVVDYLDVVKDHASIPVCAGFGVREAAQVKMLGKHADGVIVGSALLERIENGDDPAVFLSGLQAG